MILLGIGKIADELGLSNTQVRYWLDKHPTIPYVRADLGGAKHIRVFTNEDLETIKERWRCEKETTK